MPVTRSKAKVNPSSEIELPRTRLAAGQTQAPSSSSATESAVPEPPPPDQLSSSSAVIPSDNAATVSSTNQFPARMTRLRARQQVRFDQSVVSGSSNANFRDSGISGMFESEEGRWRKEQPNGNSNAENIVEHLPSKNTEPLIVRKFLKAKKVKIESENEVNFDHEAGKFARILGERGEFSVGICRIRFIVDEAVAAAKNNIDKIDKKREELQQEEAAEANADITNDLSVLDEEDEESENEGEGSLVEANAIDVIDLNDSSNTSELNQREGVEEHCNETFTVESEEFNPNVTNRTFQSSSAQESSLVSSDHFSDAFETSSELVESTSTHIAPPASASNINLAVNVTCTVEFPIFARRDNEQQGVGEINEIIQNAGELSFGDDSSNSYVDESRMDYEVTSSTNNYEITSLDELNEFQDNDERPDKRIPKWAQDGRVLEGQLFLSNPLLLKYVVEGHQLVDSRFGDVSDDEDGDEFDLTFPSCDQHFQIFPGAQPKRGNK